MNMSKFAKLSIVILTILFIFVIVIFYRNLQKNRPLSELPPPVQSKRTLAIKPRITFLDPALGLADAKITIVEFSDFRCPHCAKVNVELKKILNARPNEVRLVWKDFPFLPPADLSWQAHEAARCAGEQKKFWEYHDALFADQNYYSALRFLELADSLKLDKTAFTDCLQSGKIKPIVQRSFDEGAALGVDGAPYFFVNGERWTGEMTQERIEGLLK